ncbi:unnamed protein product [Sympodiomycopsis kandeliae]
MSSFFTSIPTVVGRSVLSPLNALPKRFSETQIIHGDPEAAAEEGSSAQTSEPPQRFTQKALSDLVAAVPSLLSFHPHPLIPLGSLQTIYSAFANTVEVDVVQYKRHVLLLPDGGTIAVDVSPPEWDENTSQEGQKRNTVVLNHGLTGGSHESYVRHVIPPLIASGHRCVVINFRGCGQTPVTSGQMYSAAKTDDLRSGILWILNRWKQTEMVLMGFSLGANVVAKYLGEEGDNTPVKGGLVLATPFDLKMGSDELAKSALYDKVMAANLTKKIDIHSASLSLDPIFHKPLRRLLDPKAFAEENAEEVKERGVKPGSLKWVDDSATRLFGGFSRPYGDFPFDNADHYYTSNGSIRVLHKVARPFLLLNSDDDPIVPFKILTATEKVMRRNPNVSLAITRGGGHLGWWSAKSLRGATKPSRWLGKTAKTWVDEVFAASVHPDLADYKAKNDPWAEGLVKEVPVQYELLSEDELIPFELNKTQDTDEDEEETATQQLKSELPEQVADLTRGTGLDGLPETPKGELANGFNFETKGTDEEQGPRHAWLKTHILEHATLIHPSHAAGWKGVQYPAEQEIREGRMVISTKLPQIGYLELDKDSRVAGCGEEFQGGKSIPGQTSNTKGEKVVTDAKGRKRKTKGLREEGTVAGL